MLATHLLQDISNFKIAEQGEASFWFPPQASNLAAPLDATYMFIYWVSVVSMVAIVVWLVLYLMKYHSKKHAKAEVTPTHNTPLELAWSIPPFFLSMYMFWVGYEGYMDIRTPPSSAYDVQVEGMKWSWAFIYPTGLRHNELHVPVGEPVQLTISSIDVLHSFFVPAFRTKMDAVPGRYTKSWFIPNTAGTYTALCTEYCGTSHSRMLAKVVVQTRAQFDAWMVEQLRYNPEVDTPVTWGEKMATRNGCFQCHSIDGTAGTGPSWKGIWGTQEALQDGSTVLVDENYVRESILEPNAKKVAGFTATPMSSFKGKIDEDGIRGLIAYIKSLGDQQ